MRHLAQREPQHRALLRLILLHEADDEPGNGSDAFVQRFGRRVGKDRRGSCLRECRGEKRWFFGGGPFTWKLSSANEDIHLFQVDMVEGKWTPVHTHPNLGVQWVLDGQIQYRVNDDEHEIGPGDFVMVPAGVPHAFIVKSPTAKVLGIQPTCECEPFYRGASEPFEGSSCIVDFHRIAQSAQENGGIEIVGPPPF